MTPATRPPSSGFRRANVVLIAILGAWSSPAQASDVLDWANGMMSDCWSCSAIGQMVQIGLGFAEQAFNALATDTANLVGLLMAIWILFFAGRMFLPFGLEGGPGGLWNKGAKKLFQFAVLLAFLQNSTAFWNYVFIPVVSAGMGISAKIVSLTDPYEQSSGTSETGPSNSLGQAIKGYCNGTSATDLNGVSGAQAVMAQINCPLATIQSQFGKGMVVGVAQLWGAGNNSNIVRMTFSALGGVFLIGIYFIGLILFPIFMIDVLMRLTIVTAIAPIALAASLFGPTKQIAEKVFWQIAQAALTLVFVSIVGGLGKATLAYVFSHLTVNGFAAGAQDWATLITMLENQKTTQGADFHIDLTTMAFYQLLGVGVIMLFMLRQAGRMASEFTGAGGGDFSGALAGVASFAGNAAQVGGNVAQRLVTAGRGGGKGSLPGQVTGTAPPKAEQESSEAA